MKTRLKISVSLFLILLATNQLVAQQATKAHKDSLEIIVKKYYDLNLKIFQANSKVEDIDKTFELFTDDFIYVHPKYGGTYTREDLYKGYVRNQKNGGYNGKITNIKILNKIVGLNAVVTQKCFVEMKDGKIKDGEPEMTLFEFRNGKISRIFEYWQQKKLYPIEQKALSFKHTVHTCMQPHSRSSGKGMILSGVAIIFYTIYLSE